MTLNQIVNQVTAIVTAHKQVRSFKVTQLVQDQLNDHKTKYPAVFFQDSGGSINFSPSGILLLSYRLWVFDLVNVAADTKQNELDVLSDTLSILMDIVAQLNNPNIEWVLSSTNGIQQVTENDSDMNAGWYVDFSIETAFKQDLCAIPSDVIVNPTSDMDTKVYDHEYIGTGNEGTTIDLDILHGKLVLLVIRENNPLHKVSNLPDSAEFTWNNTVIGLGSPVNTPINGKGERFLILYRNY